MQPSLFVAQSGTFPLNRDDNGAFFIIQAENEVTDVGFEVLTAVVMKSTIFWDTV
jgi:hypothetical protein